MQDYIACPPTSFPEDYNRIKERNIKRRSAKFGLYACSGKIFKINIYEEVASVCQPDNKIISAKTARISTAFDILKSVHRIQFKFIWV
jgi:hypothetical protein